LKEELEVAMGRMGRQLVKCQDRGSWRVWEPVRAVELEDKSFLWSLLWEAPNNYG